MCKFTRGKSFSKLKWSVIQTVFAQNAKNHIFDIKKAFLICMFRLFLLIINNFFCISTFLSMSVYFYVIFSLYLLIFFLNFVVYGTLKEYGLKITVQRLQI